MSTLLQSKLAPRGSWVGEEPEQLPGSSPQPSSSFQPAPEPFPEPLPATHWISDAAWAAVANLAQAAGPYLSILLLARSQGLAAAGLFAFSQALSTPALQLMSLQLKPLLLTLSPQDLPFPLAIFLRSASTVLGLSLALGSFLLGYPVLALLLLTRLTEAFAEIYQARWQRLAQMRRAALLCLARALLQVLSIALLPNLTLALGLYLGASLLLLVLVEVPSAPWPPLPNWSSLRAALLSPTSSPTASSHRQPDSTWALHLPLVLRRGLLLGGVLFLIALQSNLPRLLLEHFRGAKDLGLFATLGLVSQAGNLFFSAFGQGLLPRFHSASHRQLLLWLALPAGVAVLALLPLYLLRQPLVGLLAPHAPASALDTFLAFSLSQIVLWPAAVCGHVLTAFHLYRLQVWLTLLMLFTSAVSGLFLIPSAGPAGAAFACASASGVFLCASIFFILRLPRKVVQ
jgi:O-antigen/teichoic acid export membrane protein